MCYGSPKHEFIILHFSIVRFQKGKNCFNVDVVHVAILEQEWHHSFIIDCKIHFYTLRRYAFVACWCCCKVPMLRLGFCFMNLKSTSTVARIYSIMILIFLD